MSDRIRKRVRLDPRVLLSWFEQNGELCEIKIFRRVKAKLEWQLNRR